MEELEALAQELLPEDHAMRAHLDRSMRMLQDGRITIMGIPGVGRLHAHAPGRAGRPHSSSRAAVAGGPFRQLRDRHAPQPGHRGCQRRAGAVQLAQGAALGGAGRPRAAEGAGRCRRAAAGGQARPEAHG